MNILDEHGDAKDKGKGISERKYLHVDKRDADDIVEQRKQNEIRMLNNSKDKKDTYGNNHN